MSEMFLPQWVRDCLDRLDRAGYAAYAVGGCVRDACLGKMPNDYDLCTAALPEQTQQVFGDFKLVLAGVKHGTVGVITEGGVVEITTFRSEGGYEDNRHPDWVHFVSDIEDDLSRRDFTINAMAYSPKQGFYDPFGGREDLKNGILRTVGDPETRLREDALRILRGVRFAVRFHLKVEENTLNAMVREAELLDNLARERVFEELCRLLPLVSCEDLKTFAPIITAAVPELKPMVGFDQKNPHHAYDVYTHTALVTQQVPQDLTLRWAALLHDVGKPGTFTQDASGQGHFYGHDQAGARLADQILRQLKAPTVLREQVVTLVSQHMNLLTEDRKLLRRRISRLGFDLTEKLLSLQLADRCSKGTDPGDALQEFERIRTCMEKLKEEEGCLKLRDLALDGNDLMALGFQGKAIGDCLNGLFSLVLDEKIPNERQALIDRAKTILKEMNDKSCREDPCRP